MDISKAAREMQKLRQAKAPLTSEKAREMVRIREEKRKAKQNTQPPEPILT